MGPGTEWTAEDLGRRRPRATAADEFGAAIDALGIAQRDIARLFGVDARSVRRWRSGARRVPRGIGILLNLMAAKVVTLTEVERAAAPVPVPTHGSGEPRLRAALPVEPAPEARAKAATVADLDLTTAEQVYALTPNSCRWPCGDPGRRGFYFCSGPVAMEPYREEHRRAAYLQSVERKPSTPFRFSVRTISPARKLPTAV
jgi:GcrA cell cycle regulator